ncbi:MAG: methylenetetrahydrofolate reductase [Solirubrobacteraceae bacterium]|nr:methylenetetrahydrofolate reductase [Solirubrobacteraceae bacterium]
MQRIDDLLRSGTTLSFEFFPPKTDEGHAAFTAAFDDLAELRPNFASVTYGALGSTRSQTEALVNELNAQHTFPTMPHLTCIGHTRQELAELITSYRDAGVKNILALAGDPPADGTDAGDFVYADELIALIREIGDFCVGVAAFPELHPRSPSREEDRRRLAAKLELADFGMTQFFFDVDHYARLVEELGELGCDVPLIPGVMPFVSVPGTRRMAAMNGSSIPDDLNARMESVASDPDATRALGIDVAVDLSAALLEQGVPGLHLYTMNRAASVREVTDRLGLRAPA